MTSAGHKLSADFFVVPRTPLSLSYSELRWMARDFSRCTVFYSSLRHPVYVGSPGLRCVMDKRKLAVRFAKN